MGVTKTQTSDVRPHKLRPRKKLRPFEIKKIFKLVSIFCVVMQCSWATARMEQDIYLLRFVAVAVKD